MIFRETPLAGAWIVAPEPIDDERGAFARLFCAEAFAARGLCPHFDQVSYSYNRRAGTLRGLHLQRPPHAEVKLVRATAGAVWDVFVDLRAGSPTFGRWASVELTATNRLAAYIPAGFAHGFQSLTDDAELSYQIAGAYAQQAADGVRWDDPDMAIAWPEAASRVISGKDRALPGLDAFVPLNI